MSGKIILETARLRLREYTWDDLDALAQIISDPETMKFYEKPYDEAGVRRWIQWNLDNYEDLGFGLWAMEERETGRFVGDCGITMQIISKKIVPEIGYHVHKELWNRGYATEAAKACKDWIFTHTPFQTVYSYMNAENIGSWSVAQHNGMHRTDEYEDKGMRLYVYAVTRAEWEKEKR